MAELRPFDLQGAVESFDLAVLPAVVRIEGPAIVAQVVPSDACQLSPLVAAASTVPTVPSQPGVRRLRSGSAVMGVCGESGGQVERDGLPSEHPALSRSRTRPRSTSRS